MDMNGFVGNISLEELADQISNLTTFIQAIGGVILLYLVFNIINAIINKGKRKELKQINENLEEIKKLLSGKKKKKKTK